MAKEEIKQTENNHDLEDKSSEVKVDKKEKENNEVSPEEKIKNLEDKLARTVAEMENQRRRFEKNFALIIEFSIKDFPFSIGLFKFSFFGV